MCLVSEEGIGEQIEKLLGALGSEDERSWDVTHALFVGLTWWILRAFVMKLVYLVFIKVLLAFKRQ